MNKYWYESKGVMGGLVSAVAVVASVVFGVDVSDTEQSNLVEIILQVTAVFAALVAAYGRIVAEDHII